MNQKADEVHKTFLTASQSEWPSSRKQKTKNAGEDSGTEAVYSGLVECKHV